MLGNKVEAVLRWCYSYADVTTYILCIAGQSLEYVYTVSITQHINPQRTCTRVTVVVLCVNLSVCVCVRPCICS